MPNFADWMPAICFLFGVPTLPGFVCVDADATTFVVPTQQIATEIADIFAEGARHFRVNFTIFNQAGMPPILDFGDFDFGFHDAS
jgi:hypothetical protein